MQKRSEFITVLILMVALFQLGMARPAQYDEEARETERLERAQAKTEREATTEKKRPVRNIAGGIKEATVDSTAGFVADTAESTKEGPPVVGTLEGATKASGDVLDKALKGTVKVATLGFGELKSYEVEEPKAESGEPTKIKIKIPGT